jgi:phage terminase large subunit
MSQYSITTATRKVLALNKPLQVLQGGTSASKTISALSKLIHFAQSDHTSPKLTSIMADSIPNLKRGAMLDFQNIMQGQGYWQDSRWNATDRKYRFETDSIIEFFSTDDGDKLRGARRDRALLNEANNNPFSAFDQTFIRTRQFYMIDFNPSSEFWLHNEILGKWPEEMYDHIILTYKDNDALEPEVVRKIEMNKAREQWWRVYGLGLLGEISGRIYTGWQEIEAIPHEARLRTRGLDFGYTNDPTALIDVYDYNGGVIFDEQLYRTGMKNGAIATHILALPEPETLVIGDSSEPKSVDEIKERGVNIIGAVKGPGSVNHGIDYVQGLKVSYTKRSTNLAKEYRNYIWMVDKDGKSLNTPVGGFDHALDAGRYGVVKKPAGQLIA